MKPEERADMEARLAVAKRFGSQLLDPKVHQALKFRAEDGSRIAVVALPTDTSQEMQVQVKAAGGAATVVLQAPTGEFIFVYLCTDAAGQLMLLRDGDLINVPPDLTMTAIAAMQQSHCDGS